MIFVFFSIKYKDGLIEKHSCAYDVVFNDKKKIQVIIKAVPKDLIPKNIFVFNCFSFLFDTMINICIQTTYHHTQEANRTFRK